MTKISQRSEREETYLNIIKVKYDKLPAIIILNGKKIITTKTRNTCGCLLFLFLCSTVLEITAVGGENQDKIGKEVKISLCDDVILHTRDPKDSYLILLELTNWAKWQVTKLTQPSQQPSHMLSINILRKKPQKQSYSQQKNKNQTLGKPNRESE